MVQVHIVKNVMKLLKMLRTSLHSAFAPYITTVGLYNDANQLMAIGKLARAVKNEDDLALSIVVRFDVPS